MNNFGDRPNPDDILNEIKDDKNNKKIGKLKIFFGYAAGERVIIVTGCINALVSRVSGTLIKNNSCIA